MTNIMLEVKNLKKIYDELGPSPKIALDDLSFEIKNNEFVCIMGPSGSGKTTLVNILSTIDKATSGIVNISGASIVGMSGAAKAKFRKKKLGFIFQNYNLLYSLTIRENILFPLIIQIIGTVALTFSNNDTDQIQGSLLSVFIVAAVPTFLITLWAAFHRYASYNVKAIALIAGLIGFSYTVVAGFFYATLVNDMGFGEWLRAGGLEITCLMAAGLALYSVMVLPLLLPKERPL